MSVALLLHDPALAFCASCLSMLCSSMVLERILPAAHRFALVLYLGVNTPLSSLLICQNPSLVGIDGDMPKKPASPAYAPLRVICAGHGPTVGCY